MLYTNPWYLPLLKYGAWLIPALMFVNVVLAAVISYGYTFWKWEKKNEFVIPFMCFAFVVLSFGPVTLYAWLTGNG